VIDVPLKQDIQRAGDTNKERREAARAVGAGAFGGSRQAEIAEQELQRAADRTTESLEQGHSCDHKRLLVHSSKLNLRSRIR
jgi:hypothetical protein